MARLMIWAALAVLVCGCAAPRPSLPAGEDQDALVATIARRGQGIAPGEADPSDVPHTTYGNRPVDYLLQAVLMVSTTFACPMH